MEQFLIENPLIFLLIVIWTFVWKGIALWKAARRSEKKWFIAILLLNTFGLLEIIYIFVFSKRKTKSAEKANEAQK